MSKESGWMAEEKVYVGPRYVCQRTVRSVGIVRGKGVCDPRFP